MKKIKFSSQPLISLAQHSIGLSLLFKITRNINMINRMMRPRRSLAVFDNLRDISKELSEILIQNETLNKSSNSYDRQSVTTWFLS